jgi:hypothetical protein
MSKSTAQVVDLAAFRKRREEERSTSRESETVPKVVVFVPLWMWVPVWTPGQ